MKYTGIVRRLDSLGRIVIPREYRKMHKIKESDPLEIIAMENGEILIKKVDLTAELLTLGTPIIKAVNESLDGSIILCDKEKFITGLGSEAQILINKNISSKTQAYIENRKSFSGKAQEIGLDGTYVCFCPVYSEDSFGAICYYSNAEITKSDEKLITVAAKILGASMQKY